MVIREIIFLSIGFLILYVFFFQFKKFFSLSDPIYFILLIILLQNSQLLTLKYVLHFQYLGPLLLCLSVAYFSFHSDSLISIGLIILIV